MTTDIAVQVENLTYRYADQFTAVSDLSLQVTEGQTYALLGTNGAGKTTTLEILEGFRAPTSGTASIFGRSPLARKQVRPGMGIMLQEAGFAGDATVKESVELVGAISGRTDRSDRLLSLVGLTGKASTRVQQLSGGEKRRLDFACAIWGKPKLVFLDEPTTGLDPEAREAMWEVVSSLQERQTTVVLTTHYLEEAERHADRIGIMHHGKLVREGTLAELVADLESRISFISSHAIAPEVGFGAVPAGVRVSVSSANVQQDLFRLTSWADANGVELTQIEVRSASLDELFSQIAAGRDERMVA